MAQGDYYKQFTNANLFISNNANPYLISPYNPLGNVRLTGSGTTTGYFATLKSTRTGQPIDIESDMDIKSPYNLYLNGNKMYTDRIYACGNSSGSGPELKAVCGPPDRIETIFNGAPAEIVSQTGNTTFDDGTGNYTVSVNGTLDIIPAPVAPAVAPSGLYIPITVGGVSYYLQLYI